MEIKEEEEESCWQPFMKSTSIVKKSAYIMLNICTTHNGDYVPFRQRHFDLLPWNITPASELCPPLFLLKWRTLQSETGGIPPNVYMIAPLKLVVCVQLGEIGREADGAAIIWSWHYFRFWNSPTLWWMILIPVLQTQAYLMKQIISRMQEAHMRERWELRWIYFAKLKNYYG